MSPVDSRCLESFPEWLRSLSDDARALCQVLESAPAEPARRAAANALNYLFKSIDLIPDGLEDLGYLDDAFVFRVALASAGDASAGADAGGVAQRLANEAGLIREFLDADYPRLESYVAGLEAKPVRGRSVEQLLAEPEQRAELVREIQSWAESFETPSFFRDQKSLVKLRSFLSTRLSG
ncbi:MAG: YkvA family protein [Myxococcota bacterium]|jgi:uncharacterized membrane protein YkvA (DUF1232 family)|nr:YkvA family protein [Myxococcota bacterium]